MILAEHWQAIFALIANGALMGGIFGKDTSSANQTTTQQQVGGEGATGSGSPTVVAGASSVGAGVGAGSSGGLNLADANVLAAGGGSNNTVNIELPDIAALEANQNVSVAALEAQTYTTDDALQAVAAVAGQAETVAGQSIAAGQAETQANTAFGEAALQNGRGRAVRGNHGA